MKPDDPNPKRPAGPPPEAVPIHERIRRRREERGIPAYVLAERLGISPSYISLIESGKKVPSEEIARRIAEALDDDVELYVAWAHSSGIHDLDRYTTRLMRLRRYSADPTMRRLIGSGEDFDYAGDPAAALDSDAAELVEGAPLPSAAPRASQGMEKSARLSRGIVPELMARSRADAPEPAEIVLLEEGSDPESTGRALRVAGPPLRLDARLFDPADLGRLFAYRATAAGVARVADAIRPGDWVILSARIDPGSVQGIFAVRLRGAIVLSRVHRKGNELLLLPPPGSSEIDAVEPKPGEPLERVLAGRVVRTVGGADRGAPP